MKNPFLQSADALINWARGYSLWPLFFGLSCCFVEEAAAFTSRYDLARFGAEVLRGSPRQADLLIVSGTVFKKVAPIVLRLYEQMPEPKWVMSMGSCCNTGGMYDVYSVVQGVDQIIPVDVYVPGCPPRPEALLQGLVMLQERIKSERPFKSIFHLPGGSQGGRRDILVPGRDKDRDPRGPGFQTVPVRGSSVEPPWFRESRSEHMWTPPARRVELSPADDSLVGQLKDRFGESIQVSPATSDHLTVEIGPKDAPAVLEFLKHQASPRHQRLEDLTALDESARRDPAARRGFTLVYQVLSFDTATRVRLKAPLAAEDPRAPSVTGVWPAANWYEREVYDLFGISFEGHPDLRRLLMPHDWEGHPLRKDYPGRASQMPPFTSADARQRQPLDGAALVGAREGESFILNLGPHHYSTHGLLRVVASLHGETIRDLALDIGFHHRGVEKIGERQSWHQFIPYTDRVDYLSGAANNLSYVIAVEALAGIEVPPRAQFIRVILSELFRMSNHLVFYGTFVQDLGGMTPVFYQFREREMLLDIVEMITGGRLHPSWLRLGGVPLDLPEGWREKLGQFVGIFEERLVEYEKMVRHNPIFRRRTEGVGALTLAEAMDWGVSGPNLRACGLAWDLRVKMPYAGYENFDFAVPTAPDGDCYSRYRVRVAEMRQSLSIIRQAMEKMPEGRIISGDYRYHLPDKPDTLEDIESLIHHFINATRGPKIPPGEAYHATEAPRGEQGYYVVSDGGNAAYRLRIRTPGFANIQVVPLLARGQALADFVALLGSWDFILPDIDR
ncbi:MAG: NADH-quinone oxidoreductase subunit B/C/D [Deltaproteobacteria bacterium]|nr:NADH-quinone oxidoreductase subunit B/C/D [Deltaproteobacteria bacterium]